MSLNPTEYNLSSLTHTSTVPNTYLPCLSKADKSSTSPSLLVLSEFVVAALACSNTHWIIVLRQAQFETTAAEAERNAPNRAVAQEVEQNAEQVQGVAKQAALAAHVSPE